MIKNCGAALGLVFFLAGCGWAGRDAPAGFQGVVEFEQVELGFEYLGRLSGLWVERGDSVEVGQRLAAIDDSLESAATRARAGETAAAEARAALTRAGSRPEEIRALEARIRSAGAVIRQLGDNLGRERQLMAQGVTPSAVVDDLQAELDRVTADRDALKQNLALLRSGPRREEVAALESQAQATAALLDAQRARAGRFELASPLAGEVLQLPFELGEVVPAAATVISVADTSRPYADVFVPQADMGLVRQGAAASVRVDALPEALPGRVEHISRRTEFTPRYLFSERERAHLVVRVRVRIDDPGRTLHAGLPARVVFEAPATPGAAP